MNCQSLSCSRSEAIAVSLLSVAKKHNKKYCWISQKRLEELLSEYHGFEISNRTLNRDLRWMEDNGYITRLKRISMDKQGQFKFRSTLYKFTGKLFNWLYSLGNRTKRFFSFYRLPKMADYQLSQKQAFSPMAASSAKKVVFYEKDGSVCMFNTLTGEIIPVTN